MPVYNKLVRDKIPEIIRCNGKEAEVIVLNNKEYYKYLIAKLHEEVQEFIESDDVEELADIMEVIDNVLKEKRVKWSDIIDIQKEKREKRGGFNEKYLLVSVED